MRVIVSVGACLVFQVFSSFNAIVWLFERSLKLNCLRSIWNPIVLDVSIR